MSKYTDIANRIKEVKKSMGNAIVNKDIDLPETYTFSDLVNYIETKMTNAVYQEIIEAITNNTNLAGFIFKNFDENIGYLLSIAGGLRDERIKQCSEKDEIFDLCINDDALRASIREQYNELYVAIFEYAFENSSNKETSLRAFCENNYQEMLDSVIANAKIANLCNDYIKHIHIESAENFEKVLKHPILKENLVKEIIANADYAKSCVGYINNNVEDVLEVLNNEHVFNKSILKDSEVVGNTMKIFEATNNIVLVDKFYTHGSSQRTGYVQHGIDQTDIGEFTFASGTTEIKVNKLSLYGVYLKSSSASYGQFKYYVYTLKQ